jgi:CBS domain-containing protein
MVQNVCDVMTPNPKTLGANAPVIEAARLMREHDIGDVVVLEGGRLLGILTDRDIVVRVLADERDPKTTTVGEVCSRVLTTAEPSTGVGAAVRLMREKAIRRLPVVEPGGIVVGIVSIGDLAVEKDRMSALAEISAAPPNV